MDPAASPPPPRPAAPPLACLGSGWVRHVRRIPRSHTFRYPTWAVCLPMQQPERWGVVRHNSAGLVSFHDADHGEGRTEAGSALAWALGQFQQSGVDCTRETRELWLLTYPRVCGLVFKPVSFWLLLDRQNGALRAVLAEVNNTFGQRIAYVLPEAAWGRGLAAQKQLHVSPFLAVEGGYAFRFMQRVGRSETEAPTTAAAATAATTASERPGLAAGARLLARVDLLQPPSSEATTQPGMSDGLDGPAQVQLETSLALTLAPATLGELLRLGWSWPALAALVWLRIHWQAWRLWRLGLPVLRLPPAPATAWVRPGRLWGRRRVLMDRAPVGHVPMGRGTDVLGSPDPVLQTKAPTAPSDTAAAGRPSATAQGRTGVQRPAPVLR